MAGLAKYEGVRKIKDSRVTPRFQTKLGKFGLN